MRVFDWDGDLAVLLPEALVAQLGLSEGDELEIVVADPGCTDPGTGTAPTKPAEES